MRYEKVDDKYLLLNEDEEIIYQGEYVAFLIFPSNDTDAWDILIHGDPSIVQAEYERYKEEYISAGYKDIADSLYKIRSNEWDTEELNNCLELFGYIRLFLKNQGYNLADYKCFAKNGFESVEIRKLKDKTEAFHNSNHNEFTYWGSCKEEPCATNALKVVNLDGNNIKYKKG